MRKVRALTDDSATHEEAKAIGQNTLLIVVDEAGVVQVLQRVLRRDGYRILTAHSALEALELLATHDVQVILSDQRMPGINGTKFLNRAKEMYPETIRLMLTGYAEQEAVLGAFKHGAIARFFTTPWDGESIRQHIREAFRQYRLTRRADDETAPLAMAL